MVVLGDAAAMTYPSTGEGIGKAMQSGLLAAGLIGDALAGRRDAGSLHLAYDRAFRGRFETRYRAYRTAQAWSARPWLLNLLAARANRGRFVRRELEALIAERSDPLRLFSLRGMVRAVLQ
jgi:flavin-dependent dehydrogenase